MKSVNTRWLLLTAIVCLVATTNAVNRTAGTASTGSPGYQDGRHRLMKDLKANYDRRILPVRNKSHSVQVEFEMSLNQIIELDEKNQIMKLVVWVRTYWVDELLVWDPSLYDEVDRVYFDVDSIWKPDVVLYNSVDQERTAFEVFPIGVAGVNYDGRVSWLAPVIVQSLCRIKVDMYPFDEQRCPLKFGSWSYDGTKLNFTRRKPQISTHHYTPSVEWKISETPCVQNNIYYDCCPGLPYPDVTCYVVMRRRPAFYLFNLVLPTVLLIIIGLIVFCLPPESGEKVSLAITVLLSMTVFMLIVMENVPPSSEAIPLLEQFIGGTIGMLTLSTAMAVFVVNFHFRGSYSRPPSWVRCLFLQCLAPIFCLRSETKDIDHGDDSYKDSSNSYNINNGGITLMSISQHRGATAHLSNVTSENDIKINTVDNGYVAGTHVEDCSNAKTLKEILMELRLQNSRIRERYIESIRDTVGEIEWRLVATTLDRLFFVILLVLSLIMSFVIFRDAFSLAL